MKAILLYFYLNNISNARLLLVPVFLHRFIATFTWVIIILIIILNLIYKAPFTDFKDALHEKKTKQNTNFSQFYANVETFVGASFSNVKICCFFVLIHVITSVF